MTVATRGSGDLTADVLDLAATLQRLGIAVRGSLDRVWKPLRRMVPFSAGWIGVFDSDRLGQRTAAVTGHDEDAVRYLESADFRTVVEKSGLFDQNRPMPLADERTLGVPLVAGDGRPLGLLTIQAALTASPSQTADRTITRVAPLIAAAIDPMAVVAGMSCLVPDATAAVAISRQGSVHRLPGLPADSSLGAGSPVVRIARARLADHQTHAEFLSPRPGGIGYRRVTALACGTQTSDSFEHVVLLSPPDDLRGLTPRELDVLGLLVEGRSNRRIASTLFVTQRTVAAHLEHILSKLGAPTRTVAALHAVQQALYIPHELAELYS